MIVDVPYHVSSVRGIPIRPRSVENMSESDINRMLIAEMNTEIVDTYIVAPPSFRRTQRAAAVTSILASIWGIADRGHGYFLVTRRMMSGRQCERCIVRCTKKHLTLRSVSVFFSKFCERMVRYFLGMRRNLDSFDRMSE